MTSGAEPGQAQPAAGPERPSGLDLRIARTRVGLAVAVNLVRDPRVHRHVIMAAIAVVAMARMGKENQARTMDRLRAWDQRQKQKLRGELVKAGKELEKAKDAVTGD